MENITVSLIQATPINPVGTTAVSKPYCTEGSETALFYKVAKVYKHESVMEHIVFSFDIDGISRLCLQELARHRIASLTVQSTRFTLPKTIELSQLEEYFVIPNNLSKLEQMYYLNALAIQVESYNNFSKITSLPRNTLKYLLPESFRTSLVWTINARSLLNFLKLRLTPNAHYEIRHLALLILELVKANYGDLFKEV